MQERVWLIRAAAPYFDDNTAYQYCELMNETEELPQMILKFAEVTKKLNPESGKRQLMRQLDQNTRLLKETQIAMAMFPYAIAMAMLFQHYINSE